MPSRAVKRFGIAVLLAALAAWTGYRLAGRWRDERAVRTVALLADWYESRALAARTGLSDDALLARLRQAGFQGLVVGPASFEEYRQGGIPVAQLTARGFRLPLPNPASERLDEAEVGFDPRLLKHAQDHGFHRVLRVDHDPWIRPEAFFSEIDALIAASGTSFLFNSDETPGGEEAEPYWSALLEKHRSLQLLFEFKPAKSARRLARQRPSLTYRAHTIPSLELREMPAQAELSRWRRAVSERSCRFLLVHASVTDALEDYMRRAARLRADLSRRGWSIGWPDARDSSFSMTDFDRRLAPMLALAAAIAAPLAALRMTARLMAPQKRIRPLAAFFLLNGLVLAGACVVAAIAYNPETQLQLTPFRGIKVAFLASWIGSVFVLYRWEELRRELALPVKRWDLVLGAVLLAVIAYFLIRSGNASAAWKSGWEQALREWLEEWLIARPRFKEFAIGHPLLLIGFWRWRQASSPSFWGDGRWMVALGMIGPISMVNTFCHLHSPLALAFLRSANGIVLGAILGGAGAAALSGWLSRRRRLR